MELGAESGRPIHPHPKIRQHASNQGGCHPAPRIACRVSPPFSRPWGHRSMARPLVGRSQRQMGTRANDMAGMASRRMARAKCFRRMGRLRGAHPGSILPIHQFPNRPCGRVWHAHSNHRNPSRRFRMVPRRNAVLAGSRLDLGYTLASPSGMDTGTQLAARIQFRLVFTTLKLPIKRAGRLLKEAPHKAKQA